ncbi:hypothetical protein V6N13_012066 [Hibiscus sabdariffa]
MEEWPFHDGNVHSLLEDKHIHIGDVFPLSFFATICYFWLADVVAHSLQMHSSLIRRLSMEQELEDATQTITSDFLLCSLFEQGHQGCVNAVAWNSDGSLLISGSDDERGRSSLHLTHVTFSPNGEEVLLSYSGQHVYLMDINHGKHILNSQVLLRSKWKNDAPMAIRDCQNARRIDSSSFRAHHLMGEALEQLGKHKEALDFAVAAQCLSPYNTMAVENIKTHLAVSSPPASSFEYLFLSLLFVHRSALACCYAMTYGMNLSIHFKKGETLLQFSSLLSGFHEDCE